MWKVVTFAVAFSALIVTIQAQDICVVCTSNLEHHPQCIGEDSAQFGSRCGVSRNQTCFTRVNEAGFVDRGCFNDLTNMNATECEASEICDLCTGPSCNQNIFPSSRLLCHLCSGGVNSTCAGHVNTTMVFCPLFANDDRCYTARPNGNYERGCLSSLANSARCGADEACFTCTGNGCNSADFNSAINIFSGVTMIPFLLISVFMTMLNK